MSAKYALCLVLSICFVSFGFWNFYRIYTYGLGINDLFSREHSFVEPVQLTEAVAIDVTSRTLKADGHDTTTLRPMEYANTYREGHSERLFARNTLNENMGYVVWGAKNHNYGSYKVSVKKDGDTIRTRVYHLK
jgi:hypothetical protein